MAASNTFSALQVDDEISFDTTLDGIVESALDHLDRKHKDRELIGDVVKAVVAALLPMVTNINTQLQNGGSVAPALRGVMQRHDNKLVDMEQELRRDNIIIRGVPETPEESPSQILVDVAAEAGVKIEKADISTSHRVGRPQAGKPRPILARFVRHDDRVRLLKSKRKLQGSKYDKVMVGEHLAPGRAKLLKAVKDDPGVLKAWITDGRVICILKRDGPDGRKYSISSPDDLFRLLGWSEDQLKNSRLFLDF